MTEKNFYEINNLKQKSRNKIISIIKIKITIFYILTFLFLAFYWYAIACFCSVYEDTQITFIKDSVLSFAFGLLLPFILYIFMAVFKLITAKEY